MKTDTTPQAAAEKAAARARREARLAVQRHDMDLDSRERFFELYPIDHPEWGGPEVGE